MVDVTIKFDERGYADLVQAPGLTEKRVQAAAYRAVRDTTKWVHKRLARTLSEELQIVQKAIRSRLRIYVDDSAALKRKVWIGMWNIRASRLGRGRSLGRQTPTGVTIGGRDFPGSFKATMKTGHQDIFHRRTDERLHIDFTMFDISEQAKKAAKEISYDVEVHLMKLMHKEIETELRRSKINVN